MKRKEILDQDVGKEVHSQFVNRDPDIGKCLFSVFIMAVHLLCISSTHAFGGLVAAYLICMS